MCPRVAVWTTSFQALSILLEELKEHTQIAKQQVLLKETVQDTLTEQWATWARVPSVVGSEKKMRSAAKW